MEGPAQDRSIIVSHNYLHSDSPMKCSGCYLHNRLPACSRLVLGLLYQLQEEFEDVVGFYRGKRKRLIFVYQPLVLSCNGTELHSFVDLVENRLYLFLRYPI